MLEFCSSSINWYVINTYLFCLYWSVTILSKKHFWKLISNIWNYPSFRLNCIPHKSQEVSVAFNCRPAEYASVYYSRSCNYPSAFSPHSINWFLTSKDWFIRRGLATVQATEWLLSSVDGIRRWHQGVNERLERFYIRAFEDDAATMSSADECHSAILWSGKNWYCGSSCEKKKCYGVLPI